MARACLFAHLPLRRRREKGEENSLGGNWQAAFGPILCENCTHTYV